MRACILFLSLVFLGSPASADMRQVCTLIVDTSTGAVLLEEGECDTRTTPASTFKLALAVIGFDSGVLIDARNPRLPFQPGDPDWGGAEWTRETDPERWLKYSVVWYSQRITRALGAATLTRHAQAMRYGNADFTGDAGFDNGLERAWIASSLEISPREQVAFLRGLVNGTLPASASAMARTREIVERRDVPGWQVWGKTGAAYPRRADRSFDYAQGRGWFVGWAEHDGRRVVFARLMQATARTEASPGNLTRDRFLAELPGLMAR